MITLYGIKNCDTVKKARKWLDDHGVDYRFHDIRADGLDMKRLNAWIKAVGWETLLNRRGTTWRKLPEAEREGIDARRAAALMLAHPTLIKRPVIEHGEQVLVGFDPKAYAEL
ncbi:ArsC family reductase [Thioalkalivibrio denitrificans]|uniref:ArsC family reductase n=1 Tax=Thioalkalivibrio denitrificans TaxID=108003 RepID=A0A1V3NQ08_9GAMM|nr:ArsC family reductase [Thioalkalivibrio denitrificans]OOG27187.1 ArsC family reductase [Thioalkalivibrio denitrificans]